MALRIRRTGADSIARRCLASRGAYRRWRQGPHVRCPPDHHYRLTRAVDSNREHHFSGAGGVRAGAPGTGSSITPCSSRSTSASVLISASSSIRRTPAPLEGGPRRGAPACARRLGDPVEDRGRPHWRVALEPRSPAGARAGVAPPAGLPARPTRSGGGRIRVRARPSRGVTPGNRPTPAVDARPRTSATSVTAASARSLLIMSSARDVGPPRLRHPLRPRPNRRGGRAAMSAAR
jgi:hypothetical protein